MNLRTVCMKPDREPGNSVVEKEKMCADDELDRRSECACFAIRNMLRGRMNRHTDRHIDRRTSRNICPAAELYP